MRSPRTIAATALIVFPIVSVMLRLTNPGWVALVLIVASPVLLGGYALAVVIAASGFLSRRLLFTAQQRRRAVGAAILAAVCSVGASFFLLDGGDSDPWGSPFTVALGEPQASQHLGDLSGGISTAFVLVGVAAFVWLFVEWVTAIRRRRLLGR